MSARLANRRIRLLAFLFAAIFVVALARAAWLQAVRAPSLDELAVSQQRETVTVQARRGTIYDRLGVELAVGEEATTVYANPKQVRNAPRVAEIVAADLELDAGVVLKAISDKSRSFVYLARQADPAMAKTLEERRIAGLGFYPEQRRTYPQKKVGASVVGFAGLDNKGLAGLELRYEDTLTGQNGEETIIRDPFGRMLDMVDTRPVREGKELSLTIDHRLQAQVEGVLRKTRAEWGAKNVSAVVLDPRTGEILALAEEPGFDANDYASVPPDRVRMRAVTDTYEPGSTFKVVTVAGALEDGVVRPSTAFYVPSEIEVADRVIHDEDWPREPESMTVAQILSRSSNVGAVTIAEQLGKRRLAKWINRFGFGKKTGIDFPGESAGIVLPRREWSGSTIGTVPIGQGIAVTLLQMAAAYGAIANGGEWVQPHLVETVAGRDVEPTARRIVSAQTAREMLGMMQDVVSEGTGTRARVPGYTVAGKTGTAEKPESGGYSDTRYVSSFAGIVPARSPQLVVFVSVDEPQGEILGSIVAAPAFAEIAKFALQYLDVPPDAPVDDE